MNLRLGKYQLTLARALPPQKQKIAADQPMSEILAGFGLYGNRWGYPAETNKQQNLDAYRGVVYSCVTARARRVAAYAYQLYRKDKPGEMVPYEDAPIPYDCLTKPNPVMSGYFFWQLVSTLQDLAGTAPVLKVRNAAGVPVMLWPLLPSRVRAAYHPTDWVQYFYAGDDGRETQIPTKDLIYFRHPHPTKFFDGYSPLQAAGLWHDTDLLLWEYERQMFADGPFVRWLLEYPETVGITGDQADLIATRFAERMRDRSRLAEPLLLTKGAKAQRADFGNEGLELPTINDEVKSRIREAYGVSKSILGDSEGVQRGNFDAAEYGFALNVVRPIHRLIDEEIERSLLWEWDPRLTGDFEDPVSEDADLALRQEDQDLRLKVRTVNEVREERGLDPAKWGDLPWGSIGDTQISEQGQAQETGKAPPAASEAPGKAEAAPPTDAQLAALPGIQRRRALSRLAPEARRAVQLRLWLAWEDPREQQTLRLVRDAFARQEKRVLARLQAKAPRMLDTLAGWSMEHARDYFSGKQGRTVADDVAGMTPADAADFERDLRKWLVKLYTEGGERAAEEFGTAFVVNDKGIAAVANHLNSSRDSILQTTSEQIRAALAEGFLAGEGVDDLAARIRDIYDGIDKGRALTIARTETVAPANLGAVEGYRQAGVERKEWIATRDDVTREAHLEADGQVVPLEATFSVGGEALKYPGDGVGSAENVINCRCAVAGVVGEESE